MKTYDNNTRLGGYELKENTRFIVGVTSFFCSKGRMVEVTQISQTTEKAIIDFGGGLIDWFSISFLNDNFNPITNKTRQSERKKRSKTCKSL